MIFTPQSREACLVAVFAFCIAVLQAPAQNAAITPQQMVSMAGLIFSGQVVAVQPVRSPEGIIASMRISIHVEQAVRGVKAGDTVAVNEWAGLWQNSGDRYRVGQHVMLFLYAPSRAGLTSPVGQDLGRLPVEGRRLVLSARQSQVWFQPRGALPRRMHLKHFVRRIRDSLRRKNEGH